MTTIDQHEATELYLGDCILHLTHHPMQQECWNAVVQFYTDHLDHPLVIKAAEHPTQMVNQALVDFYKLEYEQAILHQFMTKGEL